MIFILIYLLIEIYLINHKTLRDLQHIDSICGLKLRVDIRIILRSLLVVTDNMVDPLILYEYSMTEWFLQNDTDLYFSILKFNPKLN